MDTLTCKATTKAGTPCKGKRLSGTDFCFAHSKSVQTVESKRKGQAQAKAAQRAKKAPAIDGYREAALVRLRETSKHVMLPRHPWDVGSADWSLHVALCLQWILVTGLTATPEQVRTTLEEAIPPEMRPAPMPEPTEMFRVLRAEHRKTEVLYADDLGIFTPPYPDIAIAAWEHPEHVHTYEPLPVYDDWSAAPLFANATHVMATAPNGTEMLVRKASEQEADQERQRRAHASEVASAAA
jgi:hypothetical protein